MILVLHPMPYLIRQKYSMHFFLTVSWPELEALGALWVLYLQLQRRSPTEQYVFIDVFAKFILFITTCQRASTTGLVISGFGLSAFLFSTISHIFFAGSVSSLLLVLSFGSSFPMILGFFFVRPIPLPEEELNREVYSETRSSVYEERNSSHTPLLIHDSHMSGQVNDNDRIGVEPNPPLASQNYETSRRNSGRDAAMTPDMFPNVHGMKLWCSSDFWLLSSILLIRTFTWLSDNPRLSLTSYL